MMLPELIVLPEAGSTNAVMREMIAGGNDRHGLVVAARNQTAGRGQRGNSWEAEPGRNLTFSILIKPGQLAAAEQFLLSEAVAIGVAEAINSCLLPAGMNTQVKWPNDIYAGDRKICGILIENVLGGSRIDYSIAGIGINVNQNRFLSDAPNPVSILNLTGCETDLDEFLPEVCRSVLHSVAMLDRGEKENIRWIYRRMLWRGTGYHPFREPGGEAFDAEIADIAPTGHLTLRLTDGSARVYAFKEVEAVI